MKKRLDRIVAVVLGMIVAINTGLCACGDTPDTETPTESVTETNTEYVADVHEDCICGRSYYTETEDGHAAYDCVKCGRHREQCICDCWCGAKTISSSVGGVNVKYCSGCGKLCPECTCRSDKAEVLAAELENLKKQTSSLGLPIDNDIYVSLFAMFATFIIVAGCVYVVASRSARRKAGEDVEPIYETIADSKFAVLYVAFINKLTDAVESAFGISPLPSSGGKTHADTGETTNGKARMPKTPSLDAYNAFMELKFRICGREETRSYELSDDSYSYVGERKLPARFEEEKSNDDTFDAEFDDVDNEDNENE